MEKWEEIKDFSNYEISNKGNIRRKDTKQLLKQQTSIHGYKNILLWKDGKPKNCRIHRLVLESFKPIDNCKSLQVNHIDTNRENNNLNNLEWVTPKENCNKKKKKEIFYNSQQCYDKNGKMFNSYREAGKYYNISPNTVKRDVLGLTKRVENNRMTFSKKI